jgi:tetratricopeptide (TPR) repeat protein
MNKYFPSISRTITESLTFLLFVVVFVLLALLIKNINDYKTFKSERDLVYKEIEYWKNVISQKPDYRDAYLKLAILEYKLGDKNESKLYLEKSLILDSNFEKGRQFQKILGE